MDALPLKSIVLIFAVGALTFLLVFIWAKRQISRFASRTGRAPHLPIGYGAPMELRQEIDRRLRRVTDIKFEPCLVPVEKANDKPPLNHEGKVFHYYYRQRAVEALHLLDKELKLYDHNICRRANDRLHSFLVEQSQSGALQGFEVNKLERFCHLYERARHGEKEFRETQYTEYMQLLESLCQHVRTKIDKGDNIKSFPFKINNSVFYCSSEGATSLDNRVLNYRHAARVCSQLDTPDISDTSLLLPHVPEPVKV